MEQLSLVVSVSPVSRMERDLGARLKEPVQIVVTDNRRTMISSRRVEAGLRVRLHHLFLDAPNPVIDALARYLARRRATDAAALKRYVSECRERIHQRPHKVRLRARGAVHDLGEILAEVAAAYFPEGIDTVRIAWGHNAPRRARRTIRLGTYTHDHALVRVHPALDQTFVPRFFVAFVVFHEVLHHVVPPVRRAGRTSHHPESFRRREQAHPDYDRALHWERDHIDRLLDDEPVAPTPSKDRRACE